MLLVLGYLTWSWLKHLKKSKAKLNGWVTYPLTTHFAVAQATGRTVEKIKDDMQKKGDLGIVAQQSRQNQRSLSSAFGYQRKPHTVQFVFNKLTEIAKLVGASSMNKKIEQIKGLIVSCRGPETRFLVRSLGGKLRIGLAEQSVLVALANALTSHYIKKRALVPCITCNYECSCTDSFFNKRKTGIGNCPDQVETVCDITFGDKSSPAVCLCPNYGKIIGIALKEDIESIPEKCNMCPGIPVRPMLAHPTKGVGDIMKRFGDVEFACEWKYDGERGQIHMEESGVVHVYSRNQEDNTSKYPDIISKIRECAKSSVSSFIADAEIVAWDEHAKSILPFQILTTRKRKNAGDSEIKVQVCVFLFDLLYINGKSLVTKSFRERRSILQQHFMAVEGHFMLAQSLDSTDTDKISEFLEEAIKGNCEGLMIKTLDVNATYEIARRSHNWLKLKKDYLDSVGDTLDLVVIGAYFGAGQFYSITERSIIYVKELEYLADIFWHVGIQILRFIRVFVRHVGTGFSDEDLKTHHDLLLHHKIDDARTYYVFDESTKPDIWFDPQVVFEVKCADLSTSPRYLAAKGLVDSDKGISLRFPRFLRIRHVDHNLWF
ncbi:ATP-dependent DNA ligase domain protein [Dictyocaulus viviparus]|uniref:DNA ligase n=1 Tax=Dictyocaulus viviparus TaxID=29172 RepID=A0A0D8XK72_DICVI|nr:ATP-dependent DNA ligase domain protein [Dictyocaulus viviparus]